MDHDERMRTWGRMWNEDPTLAYDCTGFSPPTVLGWVEDTAGLTAAADVGVNNAGGVTAQEALARGRALPMSSGASPRARPPRKSGAVSSATSARQLHRFLTAAMTPAAAS